MTKECIGCGAPEVVCMLDLGMQPPSNLYPLNSDEGCIAHPLRFCLCKRCGLPQLLEPMTPDDVRSRYDWITYNEPEGHLDDLVDSVCQKIPEMEGVKILGMTYKDDTTLARFCRKGATTYRLDQKRDLGINNSMASLETIQSTITTEKVAEIVARNGLNDIVIVRHILEHAHQPREMLRAALAMCKSEGQVIFEVPDCTKVFSGYDHCFLWEEHISYFTPAILRNFLMRSGLSNVEFKVYSYPMEDSLVAIIKNTKTNVINDDFPSTKSNDLVFQFVDSFEERKRQVAQYLRRMQLAGKRIALFGAGHLAVKFINFYQLSALLVGVIDDNSNKLGRYMPGSMLPIMPSSTLESGEVDLCLLTLNPESEQKVRNARQQYLHNGGRFISIFSSSANSLDKEILND